MNNGYRIVREDTYCDSNDNNLEDYVSNMNDIRWNHQKIMVLYAICRYFN